MEASLSDPRYQGAARPPGHSLLPRRSRSVQDSTDSLGMTQPVASSPQGRWTSSPEQRRICFQREQGEGPEQSLEKCLKDSLRSSLQETSPPARENGVRLHLTFQNAAARTPAAPTRKAVLFDSLPRVPALSLARSALFSCVLGPGLCGDRTGPTLPSGCSWLCAVCIIRIPPCTWWSGLAVVPSSCPKLSGFVDRISNRCR